MLTCNRRVINARGQTRVNLHDSCWFDSDWLIKPKCFLDSFARVVQFLLITEKYCKKTSFLALTLVLQKARDIACQMDFPSHCFPKFNKEENILLQIEYHEFYVIPQNRLWFSERAI